MRPEHHWLRVGLQMVFGITVFSYFWLCRISKKGAAQSSWHLFLLFMGLSMFLSSYIGLLSLRDSTIFTISCISIIVGIGMMTVSRQRDFQRFGAVLVILGIIVFGYSFSDNGSPPISHLRFYGIYGK